METTCVKEDSMMEVFSGFHSVGQACWKRVVELKDDRE